MQGTSKGVSKGSFQNPLAEPLDAATEPYSMGQTNVWHHKLRQLGVL